MSNEDSEEKIKKMQEMREKVALKVDELCKLIDESGEDRLSSTKFVICRALDIGTYNYYEALGLLTDIQYAQKEFVDEMEKENTCPGCGESFEGYGYVPEEGDEDPGESPFAEGAGRDQ